MDKHQNPNHQRYVEDGGCPSIHQFGIWCNLDAGHEGEHWAPRMRQRNSQTGFFWSDKRELKPLK
jgi:hypothetical protein